MYKASSSCTQNPLQPECFSGKMAGSGACKPGMPNCMSSYSASKPMLLSALNKSSARATENMNGSVIFTTLKAEDVGVDPEFSVESLNTDAACFDCSAVDQETFMKQCARDSNVASATRRLASCSTRANRDVNQDQGSRQPERVSTRENTVFNLTDAKYSSPLVKSQAPSTMLIHTGAPMGHMGSRSDTILGNMSPAISIPTGASPVGRL